MSSRARLALRVLALLLVASMSISVALADDAAKAKKKLEKMNREFTADSFVSAADDGDVKAIDLFLKAGMDVNSTDSSGDTALHKAAEDDNAPLITMLLKAGANVNAKNSDQETPLQKAVTNGYGGLKATPLLLAAKPDLKLRYRYGATILHEAVEHDAVEPVKALVAAGAELDAKNEKGETPLLNAALYARKVLPLLIAAGADAGARNQDGETPLMLAAAVGEVEPIRLLLAAKASINESDKLGNTALINAAGMLRSRMESFGKTEDDVTSMVQMLLAAGADVKAKNKNDGMTPLLGAATEGHPGAAELLVKAHADVNAKTKIDGYTPLMQAAKAGHTEVVKILVAAGADPKLKDRVGRNAASWGADYPEVVTLLGGKPSKTTAKKQPAAVSPEQKEAAKAKLEELGYQEFTEDFFVGAAHEGNVEAAEAFLDYGLPVDSKADDHVTTPLLGAATLDDPTLGLLLISKGANVNAKDENGSTPMIWAAQHCTMTPFIEALIKAGADVNAKAAGGATPLMMADVMKCADTVKVLKKAGAKR